MTAIKSFKILYSDWSGLEEHRLLCKTLNKLNLDTQTHLLSDFHLNINIGVVRSAGLFHVGDLAKVQGYPSASKSTVENCYNQFHFHYYDI